MRGRDPLHSICHTIANYLDFIENHCEISISIHFDENSPYTLPDHVNSTLLTYNSHKNPYCMIVKKNLHRKCIQTQTQLHSACVSSGFCHVCHAGVLQYIYPLKYRNGTVGFAAICGFRPAEETHIAEMHIWKQFLSASAPPIHLYDKILAPLDVMVEKLFSEEAVENSDEYTALVRYLNEYHVDVHIEDLCKHFGRSKSHISHLFKKRSGISITEFCNQLRLEDARLLLLISNRSVTEIAYDTGFSDPSYFIKRFKDKFGTSPHQYRKHHSS